MTPENRRPARGLTLIELIIVIMITSVIALTLALVMRPSIAAFVGLRDRSTIADQADTTLRRMLRDVRLAVPNSIRTPNTSCFELVPASAGGRYRMAADTVNDNAASCSPSATCSAPLETTKTTTVFDSLSALSVTPSVGDWVVVNNQNANDVYTGANRSAITAISTPAPAATQGQHRITINALQFPSGYEGGRYQVVPNNQKAVFYVCSNATGVDTNGNGTGTLRRVKNYGFNATYPTSCPAGGDVLATNVKSCSFIYDPNKGATQQSGFLWLDLEITRNNETAHMAVGAHVMNAP